MQTTTAGGAGWVELTRAGVHILAKGDEQLRDRLTAALDAAGGDPLPDVVTDELTTGGVRRAPDFAIVDEGDRRVLVRGTARATLTGPDGTTREVLAPKRAPWTDEDIEDGTRAVLLATGEPEPVVEPTPDEPVEPEDPGSAEQPDRPQFVDGHLVGARVALPAPAPASPAATSPADEEFAAADAAAAAAGPSTRDLPVTEPEPEPQEPARLLLSTGEEVTLDRGVLIGRAPRATAAIGAAGEPHLVRVASPDNEISRNHVEVYPEGAGVIIRDLGSTNGTTVESPGGARRRLAPGEPQPIDSGTTIRLAGQVAVLLQQD